MVFENLLKRQDFQKVMADKYSTLAYRPYLCRSGYAQAGWIVMNPRAYLTQPSEKWRLLTIHNRVNFNNKSQQCQDIISN